MLTLALARRLEGSGVSAVALDPGDVATEMLASGWPGLPGIPVEDGAVTSVYLASAPDATGVSGAYFEDGAAVTPQEAALDVAAQERLVAAVEAVAGPLAVAAARGPPRTRRVAPGISDTGPDQALSRGDCPTCGGTSMSKHRQ